MLSNLPAGLGRVMQEQWSRVDEYVAGLLAPHDPAWMQQ